MSDPRVGIDLADRHAWSHLDEAAVRRAAERWLGPSERRWCARQPSFREATLVVLSCKEAVFKTGAARSVHQVRLSMRGRGRSGAAVTTGPSAGSAVARWAVLPDSIVAIAAAGRERVRTLTRLGRDLRVSRGLRGYRGG